MLESVIFLSFEKLGKNSKLKSTEKVSLSLKYFLCQLLSSYGEEKEFSQTISALSQKFDVSNASISKFLNTLVNAEYIKKTSTENIYSTAKGAQYSYEFTSSLKEELQDVNKTNNQIHTDKIQFVQSQQFCTDLEKCFKEFNSKDLSVKYFRQMQILLIILLTLANTNGVVLDIGIKKLSTFCGLGTSKLKKYIGYLLYVGLIRRVVSGGTGNKLLGKCTSIYYLDLGHKLFDGCKSSTTLLLTKNNQSLNSNKVFPSEHRKFLKKNRYNYAYAQAFSLSTSLNQFSVIYVQELLNISASKLLNQMAVISIKYKQLDVSAVDLMYVALRYFVTTYFNKFFEIFTESSNLNDIYIYQKILELDRSKVISSFINSTFNEDQTGAKYKTDLQFINHKPTSDNYIDELKPLLSDVEHDLLKSFSNPNSNTQIKNLSNIYLFELIILLEKSLDCLNKVNFDAELINECSVFNIHNFALTKATDVVFIIELIQTDNDSKQPFYYLLDKRKGRLNDNDELITPKLKEEYGLVSKVDLKPVSWDSFNGLSPE